MWLNHPTPRYLPKRNESMSSQKPTYIGMLFHKAPIQKQPKCPSKGERINQLWYICTTQYYSAIKRNKILTHTKTWMNLKNILLSKSRQTGKITLCDSTSTKFQTKTHVKWQSRSVVAQGWEQGRKLTAKQQEGCLGEWWTFSIILIVGMGIHICQNQTVPW